MRCEACQTECQLQYSCMYIFQEVQTLQYARMVYGADSVAFLDVRVLGAELYVAASQIYVWVWRVGVVLYI